MAGALPPVVASLIADTSEFTAKMTEARGEMKATSETGSSGFSKLASAGSTAFLGIAAGAAAVGAISIDMGDKLETSQNQLEASLKAAGVSWDSVKGSVNQTGASVTKYGFTQAQVDSALNLGIISTQNYTEAHKNLSVAVELAAAKHVDLNTAMGAVDKATQGNTRALMQLGISLPVVSTNAEKLKLATEGVQAAQLKALSIQREFPDAVDVGSSHYAAYQSALDNVTVAQGKLKDEQGSSTQILDALSNRLSGQASASADTFAGKVKAMEAQGENLAAQLGLVLLPVLEKLVTDVMNVVTWFEQNKTAAELLIGTLGGIAAVAATAFAIDKISSWVGSIQKAVSWVATLGSTAATTAGEVDTLTASEEAAAGAGLGEGAAAGVGGAGAAAGAAGVGAGAAEVGGGVALASSAAIISAAVVTAVPLVLGVLGLVKTAHEGSGQPATGSAEQKRRQASGQDVGYGGLVSGGTYAYTGPGGFGGSTGTLGGVAQSGATPIQTQQLAVLNQLKGQLAADSAKYGATSAQAHADAAALSSTSSKWGSQTTSEITLVKSEIGSSFLQLIGLNAKQDKLNTTGAGNLKQSEFIKAVLDNQLANAKSDLAKDKTVGASKQAIDQAKQKVTDTQNEIRGTTSHIDQLKGVADQITKTKDTISQQQSLETALGNVKTETSNISKVLGSGLTITKLPAQSTKASGSIKVSF